MKINSTGRFKEVAGIFEGTILVPADPNGREV